jgi:F5/8 type C domain
MASLPLVTATASQTYASFTASNVTDGNPATSWIADGFSPQWVLLDIAAAKDLTKVRLLVQQNPAGQTTHQIYGGPTANNLSLLGTLTGFTQAGQWLEFDSTATSVRYLKVVTTQSPSWVGWSEIEVYGTSAAAKLTPGQFHRLRQLRDLHCRQSRR